MFKQMDRSRKFELFIGIPIGVTLINILKPGALIAMGIFLLFFFGAGLIGAITDKDQDEKAK